MRASTYINFDSLLMELITLPVSAFALSRIDCSCCRLPRDSGRAPERLLSSQDSQLQQTRTEGESVGKHSGRLGEETRHIQKHGTTANRRRHSSVQGVSVES